MAAGANEPIGAAGANDPNRPHREDGTPLPVHSFPDEPRTTRTHAGETIEDTRNWPGIIMVALGLVGLALTLTAAGYGFRGWAIIGGIATAVLLVGGVGIVLAEHRRVKIREGTTLTDQRGH